MSCYCVGRNTTWFAGKVIGMNVIALIFLRSKNLTSDGCRGGWKRKIIHQYDANEASRNDKEDYLRNMHIIGNISYN